MKEILIAELDVRSFIEEYRNVPYFLELCKECGNYNNSWLCPPFDFDADARLTQWLNALIVLCRFDFPVGQNRVNCAMSLIRDTRIELEKRLLELESKYCGLAFGFSGECLQCHKCARLVGKPCIHPDKARPAIEAYGFNVAKTLKNLFDIDMEWAKDGILPSRLSIVGALFHNKKKGEIMF